MSLRLTGAVAAIAIVAAGAARAEGELNIFNWGNYTNPELIEKFEAEHDVDVTVTDYDSNDTALAKVKAGGHGFDIVVPSASHVPIWIEEGLLMKPGIPEMENYGNIDERWKNVDWDPGREYTVPWQWGSVGTVVDTSVYDGEINTSGVIFEPPEELKGKINVAPEMGDVINTVVMYLGGEPCTATTAPDTEVLKKARDLLVQAKQDWLSMDYGVIEKFAGRDLAASLYWNGAAFRAREKNPDVRYGYPKEGYVLWMDSAGILADAQNPENAKLFLNFIMDPENAALISAFARYANGIAGSEEFMPDDMKEAPEVQIPEEFQDKGVFTKACPPDVQEIYRAIWTDLQK